MPPTLTPLQQVTAELAYYKAKTEECRDIVTLISRANPQDVTFTFTVSGQCVTTAPFDQYEHGVCVGYFLQLLQKYQQLGREATSLIRLLSCDRTENFEQC